MSTALPISSEDAYEPSLPEIWQARALLTSPPKPKSGMVWLIVGAAVFLLTAGNQGALDLGILVVVLVIHELGHLLGMKLFGFSDLRMFFIPFIGAAASGRKFGASATEHAVVLLLGPLPGILIGCALLITSSFIREPLLLRVGFAFMIINVFNLIPVSPLDGGRLFERLLFNRRYGLEVFFRVVTIVALVALEYWLRVWFFGLFAFFLLITFSVHMKRAHAGFSLVSNYGNLPSNPADLTDDDLAALLKSVDKSLIGVKGNAQTMATLRQQALTELYDRASLRHASFTATVLCLGAWAAGFLVPIVSVVIWIILEWQLGPNARPPLG